VLLRWDVGCAECLAWQCKGVSRDRPFAGGTVSVLRRGAGGRGTTDSQPGQHRKRGSENNEKTVERTHQIRISWCMK
jgi:hypothetical protein